MEEILIEQNKRREAAVRRWFAMWLRADGAGLESLFEPDCVYIESWGPRYDGAEKVRHWFEEWNTRGRVVRWDIRRFLHGAHATAVEWDFRCEMRDGPAQAFTGVSLIDWSARERIARLVEYGCNQNNYDPYAAGGAPQFQDQPVLWF